MIQFKDRSSGKIFEYGYQELAEKFLKQNSADNSYLFPELILFLNTIEKKEKLEFIRMDLSDWNLLYKEAITMRTEDADNVKAA